MSNSSSAKQRENEVGIGFQVLKDILQPKHRGDLRIQIVSECANSAFLNGFRNQWGNLDLQQKEPDVPRVISLGLIDKEYNKIRKQANREEIEYMRQQNKDTDNIEYFSDSEDYSDTEEQDEQDKRDNEDYCNEDIDDDYDMNATRKSKSLSSTIRDSNRSPSPNKQKKTIVLKQINAKLGLFTEAFVYFLSYHLNGSGKQLLTHIKLENSSKKVNNDVILSGNSKTLLDLPFLP
ncbi:MAG: hypothetical protein EZS28_044235 [Streblomastix strix]|uniref:Uncharacterized protein n=1 Tax=Streblomastix strix TaxID=222440 RepID=A0A5J4TPM0_9EUKA|nr:MAG: hypothetical protein EZS28_044235 [Streblomastix strix]